MSMLVLEEVVGSEGDCQGSESLKSWPASQAAPITVAVAVRCNRNCEWVTLGHAMRKLSLEPILMEMDH